MKKVLLMLAVLSLAVSLASCGGAAPEVEAPAAIAPSLGGAEATAATLNAQLSVVNDKIIEFAYGDHIASLDQVRLVRPVVSSVAASEALASISREGYKLWIVGHACKFGSNGANSAVGLKRAQQVYYELRAYGCKMDYVKAGSKGATELFSGEAAENPKQRRITFKVAKRV